jgi:hypothetical protein
VLLCLVHDDDFFRRGAQGAQHLNGIQKDLFPSIGRNNYRNMHVITGACRIRALKKNDILYL